MIELKRTDEVQKATVECNFMRKNGMCIGKNEKQKN